MAKREDIAHFLEDFKVKMGLWNIIYRDDRSKNAQTLLDLELTPYQRTDIIKNLQVEDYCEGPTSDKLNGGADMWVFGRVVRRKEVYIKITLGNTSSPVICISFHISEFPMNYPLK